MTDKDVDLQRDRRDNAGRALTTEQGIAVQSTDDSLRAGDRGPTLLEDFHLREKITHFDHERIPERVVHARGAGAHGYFQVYESLAEYTSARFLQDPERKTPVFVRFSTVVGSRGSADTARDVRGFATKFYTAEGNFDLVGNNIPVFFIQDGIKFPDLIHAAKPEPYHEIPQAATAHDNFWDFASLVPETAHMLMWILSDRTLPRSYRMMEGFGVHTFRLVNAAGKGRFVKFHWKPMAGLASLVWDEAQKIAGKDPDFHRRDLWQAIERGDFPAWELGLQIIEEEDAGRFDFDLLDATKLVPEELVPVRRVGRLVLNRNPDNFFAETEQVAFCVANVVPGIDFTNDPLLQARLFSYLDTQLSRLGGPNFTEIPINRPVCPVHHFQQDGIQRHTIDAGKANYNPSSRGGSRIGGPGSYTHYQERVAGQVIRARSPSFQDHFSQATLFWDSLSIIEQRHLVSAACFELGKVETVDIRRRVLSLFAQVSVELAQRVAAGLGLQVESAPVGVGQSVRRTVEDVAESLKEAVGVDPRLVRSAALSMEGAARGGARGRLVAVLLADGFDDADLESTLRVLEGAGALCRLVAPRLGAIQGASGRSVAAEDSLLTASSVLFDAVYVPGGVNAVDALRRAWPAVEFVAEAFHHAKPIGASGAGVELLRAAGVPSAGPGPAPDEAVAPVEIAAPGDVAVRAVPGLHEHQGVVIAVSRAALPAFGEALARAIGQHRFFEREKAA